MSSDAPRAPKQRRGRYLEDLAWTGISLPIPVFVGDTLGAESDAFPAVSAEWTV